MGYTTLSGSSDRHTYTVREQCQDTDTVREQ